MKKDIIRDFLIVGPLFIPLIKANANRYKSQAREVH